MIMGEQETQNVATIAPWAEAFASTTSLMTADDLLRLPDNAHGLELIEGRLVRMSPTGWIHGKIINAIANTLSDFVYAQHLGEVCGAETGFLIDQNPDTVLAPDAAFVRAEHVTNPDEEGFLRLAPDLVVEVALPSQYRPEMEEKAQRWLNAGCRMVWLVWPKAKQIDIWRSNIPSVTLNAADNLDGADVLPGFRCQIAKLLQR